MEESKQMQGSAHPKRIISYGAHSERDESFCLLELCSLPPGVMPAKGLKRTDHPPGVCDVRAAFGRSLNDAHGVGGQADAERSEDCDALVDALRNTASRGDGDKVACFLLDKSLRDWSPRGFDLYLQVFRELNDPHLNQVIPVFEELVAAMRKLPEVRDLKGSSAALAALADLAARAALAALADRADRAALAALADLAARAALAALADLAARAALAAEVRSEGRQLRREMAAALLHTCSPEFGK